MSWFAPSMLTAWLYIHYERACPAAILNSSQLESSLPSGLVCLSGWHCGGFCFILGRKEGCSPKNVVHKLVGNG